jgi:hypothetical protein
MFQMLHLDISKVDQDVLHMLHPATAVGCARGRAGRQRHVGSGEGADAASSRVGHRRRVGSGHTCSAGVADGAIAGGR